MKRQFTKMRIQVREPKKDDEALKDYGQQEIIVL